MTSDDIIRDIINNKDIINELNDQGNFVITYDEFILKNEIYMTIISILTKPIINEIGTNLGRFKIELGLIQNYDKYRISIFPMEPLILFNPRVVGNPHIDSILITEMPVNISISKMYDDLYFVSSRSSLVRQIEFAHFGYKGIGTNGIFCTDHVWLYNVDRPIAETIDGLVTFLQTTNMDSTHARKFKSLCQAELMGCSHCHYIFDIHDMIKCQNCQGMFCPEGIKSHMCITSNQFDYIV